MRLSTIASLLIAIGVAAPAAALADDQDADLAKQLSNPVASLISVPLQNNFDCCVGPAGGLRDTLNIQPVIPFALSPQWNLITRTILPVVYQGETTKGAGDNFGVGDITQSFFFSPRNGGGLIWGVGPVFNWPIGDSSLAARQWAMGPTVVLARQSGPITFGVLANQLWTYARDRSRDEVNATLVQPFFAYAYPNGTTISISSETSYDWAHKAWTVPLNAGASHIYRFGSQRVQLGLQGQFFPVTPNGPQIGVRTTATFLFPK